MDSKKVLVANGFAEYAPVLKNYTYVEELPDMANGLFYRWIRADSGMLTNGAFLTSVELRDSGMLLHFKNRRKFLSVWADEVLLFKKKTADELLRQKFRSYVGND
jgi:hypothetical protein